MKLLSVTLEHNIHLMRQQNTDIAWIGMMSQADVTLLCTDITLLPTYTYTQQCYVKLCIYEHTAYALRCLLVTSKQHTVN